MHNKRPRLMHLISRSPLATSCATLLQTLKYFSSTLAFAVILQSCSTLYFGHNKEEWNNLSDKEKAAVKAEYQTVIHSKNEQAHTDKINARTQSVIDYGMHGPKHKTLQ